MPNPDEFVYETTKLPVAANGTTKGGGVGFNVGEYEGVCVVGTTVGRKVGIAVGNCVGFALGEAVGAVDSVDKKRMTTTPEAPALIAGLFAPCVPAPPP